MTKRRRITHDEARLTADLLGDARESRYLQKVLRYIDQQEAADCRMGVPCETHSGITHGLEAETLRNGLEKLIATGGDRAERVLGDGCVCLETLQKLLDDTDAGDSLACLERKPKRKAKK